jgi:hypothetical protein
MKNFNKLSNDEKLNQVKLLISSFPQDQHEKLVKDCVVGKEDQDKMIQDLKEMSA